MKDETIQLVEQVTRRVMTELKNESQSGIPEQGTKDIGSSQSSERLKRLTYTVPEAAKVLGLGQNITYGLVSAGRLKAIKVGRQLLIPQKEVEAFLIREIEAES